MTPNVVEERQMRATVIDVFSRLMADRIIFFGTAVDDYIANVNYRTAFVFGIIRPQKDVNYVYQ